MRNDVRFSQRRTRADRDKDEMLALALVRLLEIIGEAARAVPAEFRTQNPSIPWQQIAGMRDRLIHGYRRVDLDIVWETIKDRLPNLIVELEKPIPPDKR